jgi:hypothetical protein
MQGSRRWSVLVCVFVALYPSLVRGQAPPQKKWLLDRKLTLTPQAVPVPALKYQLFPLSSDLKEGNAVPIYLRLRQEQSDAARKDWSETPSKWNELPLAELPLSEARAFLGRYRRFLQQFDLGARRTKAEWNYTLDQGSVIDLMLPDIQEMRGFVGLHLLRTRVDLAEGKYAAAARDLETGLAFSRHVSEAPFFVPGLVSIAMAWKITDPLTDWIGRPGAPNLYWSLTALPRPFIDLRQAIGFERRLVEAEFPYLADLARSRSAEQWDALLQRFRTKFKLISGLARGGKVQPQVIDPNDAAAKSPDLGTARKYLAERLEVAPDKIKRMPPAEVLLRWIVGVTQEVRDEHFKAAYLPYPRARQVMAEVAKRLKAAPDTEAQRFAMLPLPALHAVLQAQNRLERKIAALRVLEALRLHAAANDGQLPDKLSQVTLVPVPNDPGTGQPFAYKRDGQTATLTGTIPGEPLSTTGIRFRIEMKKK